MKVFILVFTTADCPKCKVFVPVLETLCQGNFLITYKKLDALEKEGNYWAQAFCIREAPTTIILRDGKEFDRFGAISPDLLWLKIHSAMNNPDALEYPSGLSEKRVAGE